MKVHVVIKRFEGIIQMKSAAKVCYIRTWRIRVASVGGSLLGLLERTPTQASVPFVFQL